MVNLYDFRVEIRCKENVDGEGGIKRGQGKERFLSNNNEKVKVRKMNEKLRSY